jgi:hypothetical protein
MAGLRSLSKSDGLGGRNSPSRGIRGERLLATNHSSLLLCLWEQIEKLCQAALKLEESRRTAFLDQSCAERWSRCSDSMDVQTVSLNSPEIAAKMGAEEKSESLVGQQIGLFESNSSEEIFGGAAGEGWTPCLSEHFGGQQ